uniref:EGF-like domain-containing protein n=1 Tax=Clytia hemisphaerica TaxID=252671 RepID=A0A7M6DKT7_9CNID
MTYEFVGDSYGMEISSVGILTWTPGGENRTYTVTIKATDICGNSSQASYDIEVVHCPCESSNGAACKWTSNKGDFSCVCPSGCTGKYCTVPVEGQTCKIQDDPPASSESESDGLSHEEKIAIIVVCGVIALVICVAIIKKVCFSGGNNQPSKDLPLR